ncbi:MAG: type III pantothenate kinase [Spirochaetota bacterium]
MLCAVDVGNSHIVIGLYSGEQWVARWRVATVTERTVDEYRPASAHPLHRRRGPLADSGRSAPPV